MFLSIWWKILEYIQKLNIFRCSLLNKYIHIHIYIQARIFKQIYLYSVLKKIIGANWQQFYIRKNNVNMTFNSMKQMGSKNNFIKILKSMHKNPIQYTIRGASNLKEFNLSPIQDPKIWKISKKIYLCMRYFHCAREAFMSMLVRLS